MDTIKKINRKVIPKWRAIERTPKEEIQSTATLYNDDREESVKLNATELYYKWQKEPTIENALEALNAAFFVKNKNLFYGPAQQILQSKNVLPLPKKIAHYFLNGNENADIGIINSPSQEDHIAHIKNIKERLILEPKNGLLWLEKARLQTLLGALDSAYKSIRIAVALHPCNRFILRAFSRFMLHIEEPDEAYNRLVKALKYNNDPWLQATEISLAELLNRDPHDVKGAKRLISQNTIPSVHLSELASALGTLELTHGSLKKSQKLIAKSLVKPSENSLSQALWMTREEKISFDNQIEVSSIENAYEAHAYAALNNSQWSKAVAALKKWQLDEPFSLRAAFDGSYYATSFAKNYDLGIQFCDQGLKANPYNVGLLNNKTFALHKAGKLDDAKQTFEIIKKHAKRWKDNPTFLATQGILHFAEKDIILGRKFYKQAIDIASREKNQDLVFRALAHWFVEECSIGSIQLETAQSLSNQLNSYAKKHNVRSDTKQCWKILKAEGLNTIKAHVNVDKNIPHDIFQLLQ